MGKKSKHHKNRTQKAPHPAAASSKQFFSTFNQLIKVRDHAGVLNHECVALELAKLMEDDNAPLDAFKMYYNLANAHRAVGNPGGAEKAIVHYQKSISLANLGNRESLKVTSVFYLAKYFFELDKCQEAMELYKSLVAQFGRDQMNPIHILQYTTLFKQHGDNVRAAQILEDHMDVIKSSWENARRDDAYGMLVRFYGEMNDHNKAILYCERRLAVANETQNRHSQSITLFDLGQNYRCMCDYKTAMKFLKQCLVIESETGNSLGQARTFSCMGDVLLVQGCCEKEAVDMYQKACSIYPEGTAEAGAFLDMTLHRLGKAYREIGAWDEAIEALEKSVKVAESFQDEQKSIKSRAGGYQAMGETYLEQYCTDESLVEFPEQRTEILRKAATYSRNAANMKGFGSACLLLDVAQEQYFLGNRDDAHRLLKRYLDATMREGPTRCQACQQKSGKDAAMQICGGCKVAEYCSRAHQKQAWKKGRLCHKVICPLQNHWRRVKKGKDTAESCDSLFNEFFESILEVRPAVEVGTSGGGVSPRRSVENEDVEDEQSDDSEDENSDDQCSENSEEEEWGDNIFGV